MNSTSYVLGDNLNRTSESVPSNLSARGLGINLTTADVVILYNIEFNPYNVRQAVSWSRIEEIGLLILSGIIVLAACGCNLY